MKVYLPITYKPWLETNPLEGQIMIIVLLTKLRSIYGYDTYFEFHNEDLDTVNWTAIKGTTYQQIKALKTLGLIDWMTNATNGGTTIRLNEKLTKGVGRKFLSTTTISCEISETGSLLWVYLLGRMANIDEEIDIVSNTSVRKSNYNPVGRPPKQAKTHILPAVYANLFTKESEAALVFQSVVPTNTYNRTSIGPVDDKKAYGAQYYAMKKMHVLEQKRKYYQAKKLKKNGD